MLLAIEFDEEAIRRCSQIVFLRQIVRTEGRSAKQLRDEFHPIRVW